MLQGDDNMDIIAMQMQFQGLVGGPVDVDFFSLGNANGPPVCNCLAAVNIQIDNKRFRADAKPTSAISAGLTAARHRKSRRLRVLFISRRVAAWC